VTTDKLPLADDDRDRLYSLMDMLAAVQMDLASLIAPTGDGSSRTSAKIAQVCKILRSASEDLGDVIRRLENVPGRPRAQPMLGSRVDEAN
jgi:hypothetical protein